MIERAKKGLRKTTDFGYEKEGERFFINKKGVEIIRLVLKPMLKKNRK